MWKLWGNLADAVREGTHRWKQTYGFDGPIFSHFFRDEAAKREFLMGMHGYGLISSPQVVGAFDLNRFHKLIDLGGATGHLAIAACQRYPAHAGGRLRSAGGNAPGSRNRRSFTGRRPDRVRRGRFLRRRRFPKATSSPLDASFTIGPKPRSSSSWPGFTKDCRRAARY